MRREIAVTIEELVLEGFDPSDKYAVADALERELGDLLREPGLSQGKHTSPFQTDRLNAGSVTVQPGSRGPSLGVLIGRAVFASLNEANKPAAPTRATNLRSEGTGHSGDSGGHS